MKKKALSCFDVAYSSVVGSCVISGNSSSPERWALFLDSRSHDPDVNMLILILDPLLTHSPSPHTHAPGCLRTLTAHLHDIDHAGFTLLILCTIISRCVFFSRTTDNVDWKCVLLWICLKTPHRNVFAVLHWRNDNDLVGQLSLWSGHFDGHAGFRIRSH